MHKNISLCHCGKRREPSTGHRALACVCVCVRACVRELIFDFALCRRLSSATKHSDRASLSPQWKMSSSALAEAMSALSPPQVHSRRSSHGVGTVDLEPQGFIREKSGTMPATVEARIYEGTHGAYADGAEFGLAQTPLGGSTPRLRWEDEEPLMIVGGARMVPRGGAREEDDMGVYGPGMDGRNGARERDWQIMEAPGHSFILHVPPIPCPPCTLAIRSEDVRSTLVSKSGT
jgi:hypothetical protein